LEGLNECLIRYAALTTACCWLQVSAEESLSRTKELALRLDPQPLLPLAYDENELFKTAIGKSLRQIIFNRANYPNSYFTARRLHISHIRRIHHPFSSSATSVIINNENQ
jgi:hypothetical protein